MSLGESLRHDQPLKAADPERHGFTDWEPMKAIIMAGGDPSIVAGKAA